MLEEARFEVFCADYGHHISCPHGTNIHPLIVAWLISSHSTSQASQGSIPEPENPVNVWHWQGPQIDSPTDDQW